MEEQWTGNATIVRDGAGYLKPQRAFKLPFSVFLSVLVAVGCIATALAMGLLFYDASGSSDAVLATELMNLTTANVKGVLELLAIIPLENVLILGAEMALDGSTDRAAVGPSSDDFRRLLYAHSTPLFDGVFVGFPDGRITGYVGVAHGLGSSPASLAYVNSTFLNGALALLTYSVDGAGLPNATVSTRQNYDVRTSDWYQAATALAEMGFAWTNARIIASCGCLGIVTALAVRDSKAALIGVAGTYLRLETVSQVLNESKIGETGEAFVLDKSGNLIGLSDPTRLNFSFTGTTPAKSVRDPVFRDTLAFLLQISGGNYSSIPAIVSQTVTLSGESYLIATFAVAPSNALNWTCVIIIPRADYFGAADNALRQAIIIGCGIVVVIILAMLASSWLLLTIPLRRLTRGMDQVASRLHAPRIR
jgi:hypothetical protein